MKQKVALMTAIVGGIDDPKEVPLQTMPHETYFFDEGNFGDIVTTDRIKALYFKTQGHYFTEADIIVWIDGKVQILCADFLQQCVDALGDGEVAIMQHWNRKCIYDEVAYIRNCLSEGDQYLNARYNSNKITDQVEGYKKNGYPANNGLNDCAVICRRNNDKINSMFTRWWYDCKRGLYDQIAIQYLAWEREVKIRPINFKTASAKFVPHKILK